MRRIGSLLCVIALGIWMVPGADAASQYRLVHGVSFRTALAPDGKRAQAQLESYYLRALPVTNAEFAQFLLTHQEWRRDQVPTVFADMQYLNHWPSPQSPGSVQQDQPVTNISWFAAQAYCESEAARLPTWYEWEYAASADEHRADARDDAAWRNRILSWYGQASGTLPKVGASAANVHGLKDMQGTIWEWVDDFAALMVSGDNRTQGDPELARYCGAGALSANDRENYPVLMRMALLSSLTAASTTRNLGFRCARSAVKDKLLTQQRGASR
jgi:formylglycine-generating enzyme required for sulfatase activity